MGTFCLVLVLFGMAVFLYVIGRDAVRGRGTIEAQTSQRDWRTVIHEVRIAMEAGTKLLAIGLCLIFMVFAAVLGYRSANNAGFINHLRTTAVYAEGNWWVGEHRECFMNIAGDTTDQTLGCKDSLGRNSPSWKALPMHVLPVLYHGRIDRPEEMLAWDCQRKESSSLDYSLVCWAKD